MHTKQILFFLLLLLQSNENVKDSLKLDMLICFFNVFPMNKWTIVQLNITFYQLNRIKSKKNIQKTDDQHQQVQFKKNIKK